MNVLRCASNSDPVILATYSQGMDERQGDCAYLMQRRQNHFKKPSTLTARATCKDEAALPPEGRMKLRRGGSTLSSSSMLVCISFGASRCLKTETPAFLEIFKLEEHGVCRCWEIESGSTMGAPCEKLPQTPCTHYGPQGPQLPNL